MNIFYLSDDIKECAIYHNDRHSVKMPTEYAQILSTAHRVVDGSMSIGKSESGRSAKIWSLPDSRDSVLYKATHINHPSTVWARQNKSNYDFLFNLWVALLDEYRYRYGRAHGCSKLIQVLSSSPNNIASGNFTEPTPAMPDEYKLNNSIRSYRNYYIKAKSHIASWKMRDVPEWFEVNNGSC